MCIPGRHRIGFVDATGLEDFVPQGVDLFFFGSQIWEDFRRPFRAGRGSDGSSSLCWLGSRCVAHRRRHCSLFARRPTSCRETPVRALGWAERTERRLAFFWMILATSSTLYCGIFVILSSDVCRYVSRVAISSADLTMTSSAPSA